MRTRPSHNGRPAAAPSPSVTAERLETRTLFSGVHGDYGTLAGFGPARTGTVVGGGLKDAYHFRLDAPGRFDATLTGLTGDADLTLYAADHASVLTVSTRAGTADENVSRSLAAGDYYLDVNPYSGSANYRLLANADLSGNSFAAARNVGYALAPKTVRDGVGNDGKNPADADDYFKFTVQQPGTVALGLSRLTGDADLRLYNASQALVASSVHTGTAAESITRDLQPGVYYARVSRSAFGARVGSTNYEFRFSGPIDLAGNNRATAKDFGFVPANQNQGMTEFVGDYDNDDFYRFTIAAGKNIDVYVDYVDNRAQNANLYLINSAGTQVAASTLPGTATEHVHYFSASGGTFYARVARAGSDDTFYDVYIAVT